LLALLAAQA
jgi:hypothetical protein